MPELSIAFVPNWTLGIRYMDEAAHRMTGCYSLTFQIVPMTAITVGWKWRKALKA